MSKLGTAYTMVAQDVSQGLQLQENLQRILDSGLDEAGTYIYSGAASRISTIITPSTARTGRFPPLTPVRHAPCTPSSSKIIRRRATTTNRYVHVDDATLGQAAERLAAAIRRKLCYL